MHQDQQSDGSLVIPKTTGFDALLEKVGGSHRFQLITFLVFVLQWFCMAWLLLGGGLFFRPVEFACPGLDKGACQKMVCQLDSSQWRKYIAPDFPQTIATTFPVLYACSNEIVLTIVSSFVYIGSFLGFLLFPHIADNHGRRVATFLAWLTAIAGVIIIANATNIWMAGVGWGLGGFGGNPAITLGLSFFSEQVLGKKRSWFIIGVQMSFGLGESVTGVVFQFLEDWKTISYILVGLFAGTGLTMFYLVQTPSFMARKDMEQTLVIYNTIASRNGREPITPLEMDTALRGNIADKRSPTGILDLFRYRSLMGQTLICCFVSFSVQLIFYSTTFSLDSTGYNIYFNQQALGVGDIVGPLLAEFVVGKGRRKLLSVAGLGVSSALCFVLIILENGVSQLISMISLCVMRGLLSWTWAVLYVFIAELFPTRVRSLAFGCICAVGTLGSAASPYVVYLALKVLRISPWIIPGGFGILSTISLFGLRETVGKKLQNDIRETLRHTIIL